MTGRRMYVPTFQGLAASDFVRPPCSKECPYPFNVPNRLLFYRARNAIYYLFRALVSANGRVTVLAPDYNSGNEVLAMRAAGATIHYCSVSRDMQLDPTEVERLCDIHNPDVLYVIHYLGWPQPIQQLADLCRRRGMVLIEDCALALLSELDGRPLGAFGDWSIFCLYKTLPVPNGAILVQNAGKHEPLGRLQLRQVGLASVLGRTAELFVQRLRSRVDSLGAMLQRVKRGLGRAAGALEVDRASVGDIGFNLAEVDLRMSGVTECLLSRLDFDQIRRRRVWNFQQLAQELGERVSLVHAGLRDGVCPLFFPILVPDKRNAAEALRRRGIDALEFWNDGAGAPGSDLSPTAHFLRRHVLALPIHQDLTPRHVAYVAQQVSSLNLRMV